MLKLLTILLIGLAFESAGVVLLKKGMLQIGEVDKVTVSEVVRILKAGATSPQILLGILCEAIFFACLLVLMSKSDISFLWPLTGLSFVFATFAAWLFLGEHVSSMRWMGVVLIVIGAGFISYSEKAVEKKAKALVGAPASDSRASQ
ncbi:MAG TPA: EamA family transporter [Verrucomicrobiae bacterium]|nr:EamA family transporter [Verrucomicrobiae bacterium]